MPRVARVPAIPPLPPAIFAPVPSPNRPGLGLVSRKVGAFSGGPSMPEACFPEGRRLFRGTFHARGLFPGRSAPFQGDLPCQGPISRKVPTLFLGTSHVGTVYLVGHGAVGREGGATLMFFAEGRITCASSRRLPGPLVLVGSCRVGRHEATCHPRLGGACARGCLRSDGPCAEGRRGSPVPPHPATHQTTLFARNPNIYYFC